MPRVSWVKEIYRYFLFSLQSKYVLKTLVVGIGKGCSKLPAFLDGGKVYLTRCVFGRATDTYNKEGKSTLERPYGTKQQSQLK